MGEYTLIPNFDHGFKLAVASDMGLNYFRLRRFGPKPSFWQNWVNRIYVTIPLDGKVIQQELMARILTPLKRQAPRWRFPSQLDSIILYLR